MIERRRTGAAGKAKGSARADVGLTAPAGETSVMPRAIWAGTISFGLVNAPVRMYSAIDEHQLHFNYIHEPDSSRIGYQKVCKAEGKPVPDDEIVKAFEYEKGEYVYMREEDFEAAAAENHRTIDIRDFVPHEQIDPIYFERTYYLGPEENSEKVYALLREEMYFADEIRPAEDVAPNETKVDRRELEMAEQLIDRFAGDFDPTKYEDTYRDALCEIIEAKRKGEEVHVAAPEEPEKPTDLMAA